MLAVLHDVFRSAAAIYERDENAENNENVDDLAEPGRQTTRNKSSGN